jgi:hypothetical protein
VFVRYWVRFSSRRVAVLRGSSWFCLSVLTYTGTRRKLLPPTSSLICYSIVICRLVLYRLIWAIRNIINEISGSHGGEHEDDWDAVPCSLIEIDRRFRRAYCLQHQGCGPRISPTGSLALSSCQVPPPHPKLLPCPSKRRLQRNIAEDSRLQKYTEKYKL